MIQGKLTIAALLCGGLFTLYAQKNGYGQATSAQPPAEVCRLEKRSIKLDGFFGETTQEYSYPAGNTDGKFTKVTSTLVILGNTRSLSSEYEHTNSGFICMRYSGDGNTRLLSTSVVAVNTQGRPVKETITYPDGKEKLKLFTYNENEELLTITVKQTQPNAKDEGMLRIEWVAGNPVKYAFFPSGATKASYICENEYSDKPLAAASQLWQTVDADMSSIYDEHYFHLSLKKKYLLAKQTQKITQDDKPTGQITASYSGYTIDKNGRLTGYKIQGEQIAVNADGSPGMAVPRNGAVEINYTCN